MNQKMQVAAFLSLFAIFPVGLNAQTTPKKSGTTLTGTVLGIDGKPIANAAVSCESSGGLSPRATHTDSKGRFMITGLKQDSYDLKASANGANSNWHRNIPVRRGQTKDVTLHLLDNVQAPTPSATPVKQPEAKPQK
jgi:hypothetical protein